MPPEPNQNLPPVRNIEQWALHVGDDGASLCFVATGEKRSLPELRTGSEWRGVAPTPHPDYLILEAYETVVLADTQELGGFVFKYYSYNLSTSDSLFVAGNSRQHRFDRWLTDTQVVFFISFGSSSMVTLYYIMDITEPDSAREIITDAVFMDGRYETSMTTAAALRRWDYFSECKMGFYEIGMSEGFYTTLALDCGGIVRLADGNYLYLAFTGSVIETSTLYHLDVTTDTRTPLLIGEFEVLLSASPDGQYIALLQDDNGKVDRADIVDHQYFDPNNLSNPQLVIIDMETEAIVYQTPTTYNPLGGYAWYWNRDSQRLRSNLGASFEFSTGMSAGIFPVWLDEQTAILITDIVESLHTATLLTLPDGEETLLGTVLGIAPDAQQFLVAELDETTYIYNRLMLYNRQTRDFRLVYDGTGEEFDVNPTFHGFHDDGSFDLCLQSDWIHTWNCYNVRVDL